MVGHCQVELAISVEITHGHRNRLRPRAVVDGWTKSAVAVAQQHRDVVRVQVCHDEVRLAVTVEVADGHGPWRRSRAKTDGRLKSAVAIAQEHRDAVGISQAAHVPRVNYGAGTEPVSVAVGDFN